MLHHHIIKHFLLSLQGHGPPAIVYDEIREPRVLQPVKVLCVSGPPGGPRPQEGDDRDGGRAAQPLRVGVRHRVCLHAKHTPPLARSLCIMPYSLSLLRGRIRQELLDLLVLQAGRAHPGLGPPARVHHPVVVQAGPPGPRESGAPKLLTRASAVLRATTAPLLLQLDVDGVGLCVGRGPGPMEGHRVGANAHPLALQPGAEGAQQAAQLAPEASVEVEVDEGVVDMGALGEQSGEHKTPWGHVAVVLVEDEEEGDDGVGSPGQDEAEADAQEHLGTRTDSTGLAKHSSGDKD